MTPDTGSYGGLGGLGCTPGRGSVEMREGVDCPCSTVFGPTTLRPGSFVLIPQEAVQTLETPLGFSVPSGQGSFLKLLVRRRVFFVETGEFRVSDLECLLANAPGTTPHPKSRGRARLDVSGRLWSRWEGTIS